MKAYIFVFIYLLTALRISARNNENFYFSNLNLKDGLSQISVLKIFQDTKGFIWFGTRNGLNRYDGRDFVVYKHDPKDSLSLSDNHIWALAEDNDRNLWVGTTRGLNRFDLKTNRIKPFVDERYGDLAKSEVRCLTVDSRERLWIGTTKGMYLYIPEMDTFQRIDLNGKIKGEFISVIYETKQHQMLIGTSTKGLIVCDMNMRVQRQLTTQTPGLRLLGNSISTIYEDSRGTLWVGSGISGLYCIDLEKEKIVTYHKDNSILMSNSVRAISELQGMLLVGTFDGLYTIDLSTHTFWKHTDASLEKGNLSHFSIYSLFVDKSQTVWVGTYSGGVSYSSRFNNRFDFHDPTTVFDALFGIYGCMIASPNGCLYMATEGRGLLDYHLENRQYAYYPIDNASKLQYSQNIIKGLLLEDDILWCGTNKGTIYQFDTRTKKYTLYCRLPREMSVYAMLRDEDNSMWVVTSDSRMGVVRLLDKGKMQTHFSVNGGKDSVMFASSRCILKLRDGVVLIGSRNDGLIKYDLHKKEAVYYDADEKEPNRLFSNYVTSIVRDSSGRIWIGTYGGGMALYDEEKGILKTVTKEQGLIENDICTIVEDRDDNLWISTSTGISKYNLKTEEFTNYNSLNGIGVYEFTPHSGLLLPNGEICFSGNNGFVTFNPKELQLNSYVPPLVFTKLVVNNRVIEPEDDTRILSTVLDDMEEIELSYNQNNLSIGYCALTRILVREHTYLK